MPDPEFKSSPNSRPFQTEFDQHLLAAGRASINRSRQLLIETDPKAAPRKRLRPHHLVSLIQLCDEWHVLVDEDGRELVTRSFEEEHRAESYAQAERLRLGLDNVSRI